MKHGQIITITNKLIRKTGKQEGSVHDYKFWHKHEIKPVQGIFLGNRTLSEGESRWYSDHTEYTPQKYIKVALVSVNANTNPFYSLIK